MRTKLLEFPNTKGQTLRGVLTLPQDAIEHAVLCIPGFERSGAAEKKFKALADALAKKGAAVLRFDFSGTGLSDGDFSETTLETQGKEFLHALNTFAQATKKDTVAVIAHSLGACVLAAHMHAVREYPGAIVLLAPALNQKELLRYWFVVAQMKKTNPAMEITWDNYTERLDEDTFLNDCARTDKMTKTNAIRPDYFLEMKDADFSHHFDAYEKRILHIHGTKDAIVPPESMTASLPNRVLVENGDHDLERPDFLAQWLPKAVDFLMR